MNKLFSLDELGWNSFFSNQIDKIGLKKGEQIGRISSIHYNKYTILAEKGEFTAAIKGKIRLAIEHYKIDKPAVGDWIIFAGDKTDQTVVITNILENQTAFYRRVCDKKTEKQIIAANLDYIFIMTGLDRDFNLRRIERYLTLSWESGATPVIILNKCDLIEEEELTDLILATESLAPTIPVFTISALHNTGLDFLSRYLTKGKTIALIGSSGCGKSSLINQILGKTIQKTGNVREKDQRGRHVTVKRELFVLEQGGIMIDNPGLREIQLYTDQDAVATTFQDIETLAIDCKFNDCSHQGEPGCAVQDALLNGTLSQERFTSYLKQQKEIQYFEQDKFYKEKVTEKRISKVIRNYKKVSHKY